MRRDFKRIVLMANQIDRLGGVGRFVERIANELLIKGYEVELVGVNLAPADELVNVQRSPEITVDSLWGAVAPEDWTLKRRRDKMNPFRVKRNKLRQQLRKNGVSKLAKKLAEWGSETLIICTQVFAMEHLWEAGYDALDARMPRVVGQYHGSYEMCVSTGDLRRVLKNYADVEKFVCLTAADSEKFRMAGLNNVSWLANPVAQPSLMDVPRQNLFVALGRYDAQKSLDYVIRAWSQIEPQLPGWRVELYGEGPLESQLESLIEDLNVQRLQLMGKTDDVGKVLSVAKAHVLSSQYEGLPIAIVEASLAGVPTIAFDCAPGIRDLIEDEATGFVVKQNSVVELADRMRELAEKPDLLTEFSLKGILDSQQYLPNNIVEQWQGLFRELCE